MECTADAALTFTNDKRNFAYSVLSKFISPEVSIMILLAILWVFLVGLGNWSGLFSSFMEMGEDIKGKLNIGHAKQELAKTCSICINAGGNLHDYFACPYS